MVTSVAMVMAILFARPERYPDVGLNWFWEGGSGERHPGIKSERFVKEIVYQKRRRDTQASKARGLLKSLLSKATEFERLGFLDLGGGIWGEAPRHQK